MKFSPQGDAVNMMMRKHSYHPPKDGFAPKEHDWPDVWGCVCAFTSCVSSLFLVYINRYYQSDTVYIWPQLIASYQLKALQLLISEICASGFCIIWAEHGRANWSKLLDLLLILHPVEKFRSISVGSTWDRYMDQQRWPRPLKISTVLNLKCQSKWLAIHVMVPLSAFFWALNHQFILSDHGPFGGCRLGKHRVALRHLLARFRGGAGWRFLSKKTALQRGREILYSMACLKVS